MHVQSDRKQENKANAVADHREAKGSEVGSQDFVDNRPAAALQLKMQQMADQHVAKQYPLQRKENKTGLPDELKSGVENLSGYAMDGVNVHYNSDKPKKLQAHAFAQGTDIHVAPGQEKHLPHEAWHVVQQKQGRVKATTQLKSGQAVNDDAGLEQEADVMGNRALQKQAINPKDGAAGTAITSEIVQRKVVFSGIENPLVGNKVFEELQAGLSKYEALLKEKFPDKYEPISAALKNEETFQAILKKMVGSAFEYGEINLENQQHLFLFFKDTEKYMGESNALQKKKEKSKRKARGKKERRWMKSKGNSPDGPEKENTFKLAFLGTSASVAYYLSANKLGVSPDRTIIIGKGEPWNPKDPGGRGIEFVNHPMHMISPQRKQAGIPKDKSGKDETFEGNAAELVKQISQTMEGFKKENATITKVSKEGNWYKIETDKGIYYAQNVISGLGIGPHALPRNADKDKISTAEDKNQEKKRVMDLDTFQRKLKDPESDIRKQHAEQGHLFIGVAGPNAGVDAVFEATKLGMFVDWVVTGGPAVVEGMGNKIPRRGLVSLFFDYLSGWTISGNRVVMNMTGKWKDTPQKSAAEQQLEAETELLQKQPGWDIRQQKTKVVDYMVYAQGPDVGKIYNVFDKSVTDSLELKLDKQGRVSNDAHAEAVKNNSGNVKNGIQKIVKKVLGAEMQAKWESVTDTLNKKAKLILNVGDFPPLEAPKTVALGLGSKDNSFQFIGGSMIRILNYLDGIIASAEKKGGDKVLSEKVPKKLRSGKNSEEMTRVLKTLSTPTLVSPDQLTPIRSQVEALSNHMPGYVGSGESNLVTDDQTMIAAHLAGHYANIPAALANWLTRKIIQDRNEQGVKPGTSKGSKAFVDEWEGKLEELQKLFDHKNILELGNKVL